MTTPMSYDGSVSGTTSYVTQMATMAVVSETDPAFVTILPQMIAYAELRMYRDLDFLFTSTVTSAYSLTAGSRTLNVDANTFPAGTLVVPEQINVLVGSNDPDLATRVPLLPTTKEFLDAVYGSSLTANRGQPKYFCPFDDYLFYVGPFPDQNYTVEIVGTYRPQSLGPSSSDTTFLTNYQTYTGAN